MSETLSGAIFQSTAVNQIPKVMRSQNGTPILGNSGLSDDGSTLSYKGTPIAGSGSGGGGGGSSSLPSGPGNQVLATPDGASGQAALRTLVPADLPSHVVGSGAPPTITPGPSAGSSPSISLMPGATDAAGVISLTTGISPTIGGILFKVTFNKPYSTIPKVILSPAGPNTSQLNWTNQVYVDFASQTPNDFTVRGGPDSLPGATHYYWTYQVIG